MGEDEPRPPKSWAQVEPLHEPPPAPTAEERVVVWVSIDPLSGYITAYPFDCAKRIEEALARDLESIALKGFGGL